MPKNTSKTTSSGSTNQQFNNTTAYGQIQPESNKYIDAFENYRPQVDPTIGFRAGDAKRRLNSQFANPLGGYATPAMKDAIMRSESRGIDQEAAQQFRAGQYDVNSQRMGQLGSLASMMAPRIVQTGSSGTSSGTQTGTQNTEAGKNLFGNILDVGMGAASMAMF